MTRRKLAIPEELFEDLRELGMKYSLTPEEMANQLLEKEMKRKPEPTQETKTGPRQISEQLKDRKVTWGIPKGTFALATLIDDVHFRRLRRWMNRKEPLEMVTNDSSNELMIINRELVDLYNAKAKRVDVAIDAGLVKEAKKLDVNIEEAATRHFKNVKRAYP